MYRKWTAKIWFIFPPHLTNACALPGRSQKDANAPFHSYAEV